MRQNKCHLSFRRENTFHRRYKETVACLYVHGGSAETDSALTLHADDRRKFTCVHCDLGTFIDLVDRNFEIFAASDCRPCLIFFLLELCRHIFLKVQDIECLLYVQLTGITEFITAVKVVQTVRTVRTLLNLADQISS